MKTQSDKLTPLHLELSLAFRTHVVCKLNFSDLLALAVALTNIFFVPCSQTPWRGIPTPIFLSVSVSPCENPSRLESCPFCSSCHNGKRPGPAHFLVESPRPALRPAQSHHPKDTADKIPAGRTSRAQAVGWVSLSRCGHRFSGVNAPGYNGTGQPGKDVRAAGQAPVSWRASFFAK